LDPGVIVNPGKLGSDSKVFEKDIHKENSSSSAAAGGG
jgi:hypothetical protein